MARVGRIGFRHVHIDAAQDVRKRCYQRGNLSAEAFEAIDTRPVEREIDRLRRTR